jgi:hypothetical protein
MFYGKLLENLSKPILILVNLNSTDTEYDLNLMNFKSNTIEKQTY